MTIFWRLISLPFRVVSLVSAAIGVALVVLSIGALFFAELLEA